MATMLFFIVCDHCQAEGPVSYDPKEAEELWNQASMRFVEDEDGNQ
jgi:hypothetical protein